MSSNYYFTSLPTFLRSFGYLILDSPARAAFWIKMRLQPLSLSGLVTTSLVTNLYVSSYSGTISTLELSQNVNGSYSLSTVAVNTGSSPNPSWLTKDEYNSVVYCVDEGLSVPDGSIASYSTSSSGELTQIDRHSTPNGPVSSIVYNGGKGLAVAH